MTEFEPIDINFLINEEEVRKSSKRVRDELRGTVNDIGKSSEIASRQINNTLRSSRLEIEGNTRALARQNSQFRGLNNSISQITRELPAFTFSAQTGFLAISNNLPILVDEISRLKVENDALTASGKKSVPIWSQVIKSLTSWTGLLNIGIVLLTLFGPQIIQYISSLLQGRDAIDETAASQEALNRAFESSSYKNGIKEIVEVGAAFKAASTSVDDKRKALELYNEKLGDALGTANSYNEAEKLFRDKSQAYVQALLFRAAAVEAVNEASEKLIEIAKEEDRVNREIEAKGGTRSATSTFATKGLRRERNELEKERKEIEATYTRIINTANKRADDLVKAFELDLDGDDNTDAQKLIQDRKNLLEKIAELDREYGREQYDNDQKEILALRDKFAKVRELVEEFNKDPKNAKIKIDLSGLDNLENEAETNLRYSQETRFLRDSLAEQKQLYEDFNEYQKQFGVQAAKEEYAARLGEYDTFLKLLKQRIEENQDSFDAVADGTATEAQAERVRILEQLLRIETRNQQQQYNELLSSLQSYEQKRQRIITDSQAKVNQLLAQGNAEAAEQLKRQTQQELDELDEEFAKNTDAYNSLLKGVENISEAAARSVIANARKMVDALVAAGRLSEDTAREITAKIDALEQDLNSRPAKRLDKISSDVFQLSQAFLNLGESLETYDEGLADTITTIGELAEVTGEAAKAAASFSTGDIIGGVSSAINAIAGLFRIGAKARESRRKAEAELKRIQQDIADGERELNRLQRERNLDKAKEVELTLKNIRAQREALELSKAQLEQDERRLLQELENERYVVSSRTEKYGGFLGIGRKTRVVNEYADLLGLTFEEIEALYERGQLTDRANELFEQLRKIREEGADVNALLGDLEQQSQELFTGTTAEGIADSIIEGLRLGYDGVEDFAGDIERILQQAMLNGLKYQYLEEPVRKLYEQFANFAESDGQLTESEVESFRNSANELIQNAIQRYDQLSEALDLSAIEQANQTGLSGAIRRELTEETGSELTGLFRGQYDVTKRLFELTQRQLALDEINRDAFVTILRHQAGIETNTANTVSQLELAVKELTEINKNTKPQGGGNVRDLGR